MNFDFLNALNLKSGGILIVMVGPPGAGKTTTAEKIYKKFDNFVIVSPDRIRKELTGNERDQSQNDIVFAKVYDQLTNYLSNGTNVIYDATNCRSTYRHRIISACRKYVRTIICVIATTPISECIKNNAALDNIVPETVIEKMYFSLRKHPPIIFEGFDMIVRF